LFVLVGGLESDPLCWNPSDDVFDRFELSALLQLGRAPQMFVCLFVLNRVLLLHVAKLAALAELRTSSARYGLIPAGRYAAL